MSAGAEWDRAGLGERKRLYCEALGSGHDPAERTLDITKPWKRLDVDTQRAMQRAWTEKRELEASAGDSEKAEKRLDIDRIIELVQRDDNSGLCIECGDEVLGGIEPDARRYRCECCGAMGVYGAQELLVMTQSKE